jgi:hypothetical protein
MWRFLLSALFLLVFGIGAMSSGQVTDSKHKPGRPDFTGTWKFDASRSKLDDLLAEMVRTSKAYELKIVIEQDWPVIKITQSSYFDTSNLKEPFPAEAVTVDSLYADGRGENDPIDTEVSRHQTVAKIVDNKLVLLLFTLDDYNKKTLAATVEYSLAEDGNTLIRKFDAVLSNKKSLEDKTKPVFDALMVFTRSKK